MIEEKIKDAKEIEYRAISAGIIALFLMFDYTLKGLKKVTSVAKDIQEAASVMIFRTSLAVEQGVHFHRAGVKHGFINQDRVPRVTLVIMASKAPSKWSFRA